MLFIEQKNIEQKACIACGGLILLGNNFCKHCGARQNAQIGTQSIDKWNLLKQGGLFYGINIVACCCVRFIDYFKTLSWFLFFDILIALVTVIFFADKWAENKKLLQWRGFSWQKLAAYAAIAIAGQIVVQYSVTWLNIAIYSKNEEYYTYLSGGNYLAIAFLIFFTAAMPAIFEELGFRGYLMQLLLKVTDREQAIYISAFLFAILHISLVSLFWLIPFALFVGITRLKENTLWYGIFFHFCFNLSACVFQLR